MDANSITIVMPNIFQWVSGLTPEEIYTFLVSLSVVASILIKWIIPHLNADSKWLPIVKFIGSWIALNRTKKDGEIRNTPKE